MSKELIERLRVFAGDPVLGGVIEEAADRIEELEADLATSRELTQIWQQLEQERDEWKARAEFSYRQRDELEREIERKMSAAAFVLKERDTLQADNAELVAVLELLSKYIAYNGDDWVQRTALEALAKVRKP